MEFGICKNIHQYDVQMTSNYVKMSIKLCLNVGNEDYIILCNFGGLIISGLEAEEGVSEPPPGLPFPVAGIEANNKPVWIFISLADTCDLETHAAFHRWPKPTM